MTLMRWNPYRNLVSLPNDLDDFFRGFGFENTGGSVWRPNVDVSENETSYELLAELPGMKKEDVKITVENGYLTLSGERKYEDEKKDKNVHIRERAYGKFERSFKLPEEVKSESIKAKYENGVLRIEIPKAEKVKPKEIAVN